MRSMCRGDLRRKKYRTNHLSGKKDRQTPRGDGKVGIGGGKAGRISDKDGRVYKDNARTLTVGKVQMLRTKERNPHRQDNEASRFVE